MKKSLSVISSLLFAALCLGFAFNAYAQDVTALNDANTVILISEQNYVYILLSKDTPTTSKPFL